MLFSVEKGKVDGVKLRKKLEVNLLETEQYLNHREEVHHPAGID